MWSSSAKTHRKVRELVGSSRHSTTPYGRVPAQRTLSQKRGPSQEVHHRIALPVAVATLEMDRNIAIGTHGNGVGAPKIGRSCGVGPGAQLAAGVGMRSNQGPHRQEIRVIEDNRPVDTGQFDQLPLLL